MNQQIIHPSKERTESLLDAHVYSSLFKVLWLHRKVIIRITVITTILVTAYSFIMPHTYSSSVSVLPPKREEKGLGLMDVISGGTTADMFDLGATLGFGGRASDIFVKILSSRTISDSLILKYDLADIFGISKDISWRYAAIPLRNSTNIEATKDGMVTLTVTLSTSHFPSGDEITRVKNLAADIANEYIRLLDIVNRDKLVSTAKNTRLFIQQQLIQTKNDLDSTYADLVAYQEKNKALMVDKQLDALVNAAGALKIQLAEASAELGLAQRDLRSGSRAIQDLQGRVEELQKQYNKLEEGQSGGGDFVLAFMKLPRVARDLSLLVRKVKILEEVNGYLNKQYFKERIQEERDVPTVQVLDEAIPAYQKTSPKRIQWLLLSFFAGFFGSVLFVLFRESLNKVRARRHSRENKYDAVPLSTARQ